MGKRLGIPIMLMHLNLTEKALRSDTQIFSYIMLFVLKNKPTTFRSDLVVPFLP
jgi:hypothetical protein